MPEHTRGPWTAEKARKGDSYAVWGPVERGCHEEIARCCSCHREGNAHLISAAPDLLAAVRAALEADNHFSSCSQCGGSLCGDVWYCAEYSRLRGQARHLLVRAVAKVEGTENA